MQGKELFYPIIVRSAPFYQNFYGSLAGIQAGQLYYPLAAGRMPHVDFNDVAKVRGEERKRKREKIKKGIKRRKEEAKAGWEEK